MNYKRPTFDGQLSIDEKESLLREYVAACRERYQEVPQSLNVKVPRDVFDGMLDGIGGMLLDSARKMCDANGALRDFLDANPLPVSMAEKLPDEFRAFCLALNALKQWLAAEQAATDRYLLGGRARELCRNASDSCIVTGNKLEDKNIDLHHPLRDGRPPIALSKEGHAAIEEQTSDRSTEIDDWDGRLRSLKRKGSRSWKMLRLGCLSQLGNEIAFTTSAIKASSRSFAKAATSESGKSYDEIIAWLDMNNLGLHSV